MGLQTHHFSTIHSNGVLMVVHGRSTFPIKNEEPAVDQMPLARTFVSNFSGMMRMYAPLSSWPVINVDRTRRPVLSRFFTDSGSTIRLRCNGWRKHDLLKIFVRSPDGGAGPVKCCDLTIGLVKGEPSLTTHGLLWADPEDVDGAVDWEGRWADQDVSRR